MPRRGARARSDGRAPSDHGGRQAGTQRTSSSWIERKCGYTVDNLLAAEIVTADGQVLTASTTPPENPQLFWGTRGGGGNFGVATAFELKLHAIGPTLLAGMLIYPAAMATGCWPTSET